MFVVSVENWSNEGNTRSEDEEGELRRYPQDFEGLANEVNIFRCPVSNMRVIISNAIPDHDVLQHNARGPCETMYAIEMPLDPVFDPMMEISEIPLRGMIAMAKNGVPAFGPQESDGLNAVDITLSDKFGANFWYGHAGGNNGWHVHNPRMGIPKVNTTTFLGYSLDGFEMYGPLTDEDALDLDDCNGWLSDDGTYRYHVKSLAQVDDSLPYCRSGYNNTEEDPLINWAYVLGCYSGDITNTFVYDSTNYTLPDDCVEDTNLGAVGPGGNGGINIIGSDEDGELVGNDGGDDEPQPPPTPPPIDCEEYPPWDGTTRPNIIVMQPDDLVFMDEWSPPPNNPDNPDGLNRIPGAGMPNIEELRQCGLQMMQAYAASPVCGTSRFSTITGKMPSRAISVRNKFDEQPSTVTIPTTKLQGKDCKRNNLAHAFRDDDYTTAMIGKWHLSKIDKDTYTYSGSVGTVQECGFDFVDGLYIENFVKEGDPGNNYHPGNFSHNMEWITYEAIKFINETTNAADPKPFFMYFNPTVPHGSQDVLTALNDYPCTNTSNGVLPEEPWIKYMSEDEGCEAYRDTVKFRAAGDAQALGKIWVDDAVGALIHALKTQGVYENTIFLFQEDHGMDAKGSLYENGLRIPQFIHYPARIQPGTKLDAPVSTVDIAATMLDYAEIDPPYDMDGVSWKDVVGNYERTQFWKNERCLFFEVFKDRAVRCGCYKFLDINSTEGDTWRRGDERELANDVGGMLFDLCDMTDDYVTDNDNNREGENATIEDTFIEGELVANLECYLMNTDPGLDPSYDVCGPTEPDEYSATPSDAPTESPSNAPSGSPSDSASDAPSGSPSGSDCVDSLEGFDVIGYPQYPGITCVPISKQLGLKPPHIGRAVCAFDVEGGGSIADRCPETCAAYGIGPCASSRRLGGRGGNGEGTGLRGTVN